MAIYHQDIADIELNSGSLHRSFLNHSIGLGDAAANRFGVRVFRDGAAETLSGVTCHGFFRNANGENIALTSYGTIDGNVAYVTLPQACYNVEGMFTLAIKLVGGGVTGTMRIIDGVVDNTNTGSAVAPTGSVPTYQEVLSVYEQMQAAVTNYDAKVAEQDGKISDLKSAIAQIDDDIYGEPNYTEGFYINNVGALVADTNFSVSDLFEAPSNTGVNWNYGTYNSNLKLIEYDASGNVIEYWAGSSNASSRTITTKTATKFIRIGFLNGYSATVTNTAKTQIYYEANRNGGFGKSVRDDLEHICGKLNWSDFAWISDSYVTESGVITPYNGWHRTDYIPVNPFETIRLSATSAGNNQLYNVWFDANKNPIHNFLCNSSIAEYVPPENAKYFMLSTASTNSVKIGVVEYSFEKLAKNIGFDSESVPLLNSLVQSMRKTSFEWIDGSYVKNTTGEIVSDETWHRTDYIDIENVDKIYLFASSGSSTQKYNCWYTSEKAFISSFLCNNTITEYTPPTNAKYFILSTSKINTVTRGIKQYSIDAIKDNLGIGAKKSAFTYRGSLSANATYDTQIGIAPKIGFKFGLFASLSNAFDCITIQFDAYSPNQIIIDDTNVTLKYRFASDIVLPHGVTIADDVSINILMDNPSTIKVTVASKGVQNTVSDSFSITAYETLKVLNGNQALSNLIITTGCTTVNRDVWVFGDSYLGMTSPARWPYYLNANGFTKNVMLCGSTGSGKAESAIWFNSFFALGTPKKIVWCMGMNYSSDGSSAPASGWLTQVQDVKGVCDANSIELILATIPTIPTKNHEQKNAYVRASGLRYIDFAKAVGAQSDGTWYNGMLSSDNVHPSETGAIALYNMAIASVPELTYDYR